MWRETHPLPLSGELLTSWYARRSHGISDKNMPRIEPARDRERRWRHPDIRPPAAQLRRVANFFDVPVDRLAASALNKRYKKLPLDFLAWHFPPFANRHAQPIMSPELQISWCSRCLAEDFAEGRPAHIRHDWILAAMTFCHRHRWPLAERCGACDSYLWKFAMPASGPLRMICRDCWRPLEQTRRSLFEAEAQAGASWRYLIDFETQIEAALMGRLPDQTLFNDTSARQLLDLVRDLCRLLLRNRRSYLPQSIPLNGLICPTMAAGEWTPVYRASRAEFPLATAGLAQRRYMLAAACAIIDARSEIGAAFFQGEHSTAIERFLQWVDRSILDRHMNAAGRWPSLLTRRIRNTRTETARRDMLEMLRSRLASLERGIAFLQQ